MRRHVFPAVLSAVLLGVLLLECGCGPGVETADQPAPAPAAPVQAVSVPAEGRPENGSQTSEVLETSAAGKPQKAREYKKVMEPAVAGLFYEAHPEDLARQVDGLLADPKAAGAAAVEKTETLRGLVCPHAGLEYSGPVAAVAYRQLRGSAVGTVVVMAPSHTARFSGASIPDVEAFRTPLGLVPVSPKAAELARVPPFSTKTKAEVARPGFWRQSPKALPPFGQEDEHTFEHSLEVQLPFLQRVLGEFELVPIVFGKVDPAQVAAALEKAIDGRTLVVASSDLSHYHPYETAADLDRTCIEAIRRMDTGWMAEQEACGKGPILALMHLARKKGWQPKVLDYRNSGDTSGDKSRVVGYAAIALVEGATPSASAPARPEGEHTAEERKFLLALARRTVEDSVGLRGAPEVAESDVPERLRAPGACFVTLNKDGKLRGCIGHIFPRAPLYKAVVENAMSAALSDHRFPSVRPAELKEIEIEISLLTVPRRLEVQSPTEILQRLRPKVDGVVLRLGARGATYLPQVWNELPGKEQFLGQLAEKAGLPPDAWRDPDAELLTYQAEVFGEARP